MSFVRNLILARLLTKADFGLAAALSVAVSLLEFVSRMSLGKQIVQANDGDLPEFQMTAHSFQVSVGIVSALLIILSAYPMALAFGVSGLTWAFAIIAVVPLARGAMHLDVIRMQRNFRYGPGVVVQLIPQFLATLAAWPLAVWLGDFRAVLWIMLGKEVTTLAMSHAMAERPYRWKWSSNYAKGMVKFGWPLVLTGLVMFASQQGDQMLVGAVLSLEELASYSIAFSLCSIPFVVFGNVATALILPLLAKYQDNLEEFTRHYRLCLDLSAVAALATVGPLMVLGDSIVRLLYGPKYSDLGSLMMVFGAVVALRFFRLTPAIASMAKGDTINQLMGNIARAMSLPVAMLLVAIGFRNVLAVAACGLIGEILSIFVSIIRIKKRQNIAMQAHIRPLIFMGGWIAAAGLQHWLFPAHSIIVGSTLLAGLWIMGIVIAVLLLPDLFLALRKGFGQVKLARIM